jgi:hypothetical protein
MVDFEDWKEKFKKEHNSWFVKVTGAKEKRLVLYTHIHATGLESIIVRVLGSVNLSLRDHPSLGIIVLLN